MSYKNTFTASHLEGMIWSRYHSLLTYFMQKFIRQKYTPKYCRTMSFLHRNMHISTTNRWNQMGRDSNLQSEAWLSVGTCIIMFGKILIALLATQQVPNIFGKKAEYVRRFWLHAVQHSPQWKICSLATIWAPTHNIPFTQYEVMVCSVLWHSIHSAPVSLTMMSYKNSFTTKQTSTTLRRHDMV